jgi:polyprenyl-phospho-N-acetylgalactosaminyl synthase
MDPDENVDARGFDPARVWFVIPAYNEGVVVGDVVTGVVACGSRLVVVDDRSTDDTADRALDAGAVVVRHPVNLGQGAALQTGIEYALGQDARVIVTFDADGQHRVQDALRLAEAIWLDEADIVCGSRFLGTQAKDLPARRRALLRLAVLFTRLTTGVPVTDAHNGLRALNRRAATSLRITQNRMAHASELIAQVRRRRLRYMEMPVEIVYSEYTLRKGQRMSNSFNILTDLLLGWLPW